MKAKTPLLTISIVLFIDVMLFAAQSHAATSRAPFSIGHSFSSGEVLSADVLNQAFSRIERGINLPDVSDIIGTWSCSSRRLKTSPTTPADGGGWTTPANTDNLYQVASQTVTFTANSTTSFSFNSTFPNLFHPTDPASPATGRYSLFGSQLFIRSDSGDTVGSASLKMLGSNNIFLVIETGSERVSSTCNQTTLPPNRPTNLTSSLSGSTVNLSWSDNASNETGFRVYRRQVSTFQGRGARARALVSAGGVTSVTVRRGGFGYSTSALPTVEFIGGGGTGASGTAQVVNGRVTGVTITSAGSGYTHAPRVFFRTASAFQVIATTSANATTFTDSPGTGTYIYTVTAINTSGQSPSANIVLVTVP